MFFLLHTTICQILQQGYCLNFFFPTGAQAIDNPLVRRILEALHKEKGSEEEDQDKKGPSQTFSSKHSPKGKKSSSVS